MAAEKTNQIQTEQIQIQKTALSSLKVPHQGLDLCVARRTG
jgi:hypothetical protein